MSIFCPKCGAENSASSKFCHRCGAELADHAQSEMSSTNKEAEKDAFARSVEFLQMRSYSEKFLIVIAVLFVVALMVKELILIAAAIFGAFIVYYVVKLELNEARAPKQ
jgi:uncharacterized membrane protein YvbJ